MRTRRPCRLSHRESGRHARRIRGSGLGRRSGAPHGRHRLRRRQAGFSRRGSSPPLVRSRMSAPSFSFHPAAIEEALSAAPLYHEPSPLAATRFVAELNEVIDRILEAPHLWPRSARGTRKLKLPCFPFLVI